MKIKFILSISNNYNLCAFTSKFFKIMKTQTIVLSVILFALQACHKDKPAEQQQDMPSAYFYSMKTGNYWAYRVTDFMVQPPRVTQDTLRVVDDTIVNGIVFYQFSGSGLQLAGSNQWLGDSSGYIIRMGGARYPLSLIANDTLSASGSDLGFDFRVYRTGVTDTLINVPIGGFSCVESILDFYYLQNVPPFVTNPRQVFTYYSKNVGIVKAITWYASSPDDIVSELTGYYVQP